MKPSIYVNYHYHCLLAPIHVTSPPSLFLLGQPARPFPHPFLFAFPCLGMCGELCCHGDFRVWSFLWANYVAK